MYRGGNGDWKMLQSPHLVALVDQVTQGSSPAKQPSLPGRCCPADGLLAQGGSRAGAGCAF